MTTVNTEPAFNLKPDLIYVNHAAVSPWPTRTVNTVKQFADENGKLGSLNYPQWLQTETLLREQLRYLINADSSDEIALLKSTSEALSVVAYGLDWKPGDTVITCAEEFPSNRLLWQSLEQFGVEVKLIEFLPEQDAEQMIIDAMNDSTRLVSLSAVQYASGRRMQLQRIGEACKQKDILFCVDAIQQLGALQFDVNEIHADFVAADGHKWMMGPEGLALFYCRQKHLQHLKLNQYGWHMVEHAHDFSRSDWEPAHNARRFECGSPNMTGAIALSASLSLIEETGVDQIERQVLDNTAFLIEQLTAIDNIELISASTPSLRSGIVTFRHKTADNDTLFVWLKQQNIFCAPRGGGIRLSPHFYTPRKQLAEVIKQIKLFNA